MSPERLRAKSIGFITPVTPTNNSSEPAKRGFDSTADRAPGLPSDSAELMEQVLYGITASAAAADEEAAAAEQLAALLPNPVFTGPAEGKAETPKQTTRELKLPGNMRGKGYHFIEHAREKFAAVRSALSIPPEQFLASFADVPATGAVCSGGRSGSVVVSTIDEKFILKTATPTERNTLLTLLDDYIIHLQGNAGSFLAKFVGLYEVRAAGSSRTSCVILMSNVLAATGMLDIAEVYDLKGSYVDRRSITEDTIKSSSAFTRVRKDMDLRRLFHLGPSRTEIVTQLKLDVHFLQSRKLMDYSMMIGAWCPFCGRNLHSRMPLDPTHVPLKLLQACDQ
jgi:hypothetical protein